MNKMNECENKQHSPLQHVLQVGKAKALTAPCTLELWNRKGVKGWILSPCHSPNISVPLYRG